MFTNYENQRYYHYKDAYFLKSVLHVIFRLLVAYILTRTTITIETDFIETRTTSVHQNFIFTKRLLLMFSHCFGYIFLFNLKHKSRIPNSMAYANRRFRTYT